jgi:hypothetical protein
VYFNLPGVEISNQILDLYQNTGAPTPTTSDPTPPLSLNNPPRAKFVPFQVEPSPAIEVKQEVKEEDKE